MKPRTFLTIPAYAWRSRRIMAKHDSSFNFASPSARRVRLFARAIGLDEDIACSSIIRCPMRSPASLPRDYLSVSDAVGADSVVVSQRSQLRRQEHGVIFNRALCLGPAVRPFAFRSQFSYKQLNARGIAGRWRYSCKKKVRTAPFLVVPPLSRGTAWPRGPRVSRISVRKASALRLAVIIQLLDILA